MRYSHVTLIALAVSLSSASPGRSAPVVRPVNRLPIFRIGALLPSPSPSLGHPFAPAAPSPSPQTAAVGFLPLNSPVGNHVRGDMDELVQLVARALQEDESGAVNLKPIIKGVGNAVGTAFNLFDIFHHSTPTPAPAPPATTTAEATSQPQRRDVDDILELVSRAAVSGQGDDESGAFNILSAVGSLIKHLPDIPLPILRREDIEGLLAREDFEELVARADIHQIAARQANVPHLTLPNLRISSLERAADLLSESERKKMGLVPVVFHPQPRDFNDFMGLLAREDTDSDDQSGALNFFKVFSTAAHAVSHLFGGGDNNQPQTRELLELFARDDADESGAFNIFKAIGTAVNAVSHLFGGGSNNNQPQTRELLELLSRADVDGDAESGAFNIFKAIGTAVNAVSHLFGGGSDSSQPAQQTRELFELFARADFDDDESGALAFSGIVNAVKGAIKNGEKIGKVLGIANDATSIVSNVKSALTPPPPPAPAAPATRSLNELD